MIVGVLGQMGSGKDTVSDFLVKNHGFVKIALADPIKQAAQNWFGWDDNMLWGPSHFRNVPDPTYAGLTPRRALQFMGTEIGRSLYRNVWVDKAIRTAKWLLDTPGGCYEKHTGPAQTVKFGENSRMEYDDSDKVTGVVISDVRFQNEVDAIRAAGGQVWRIIRAHAVISDHPSETEQLSIPVDHFAVTIENLGTLDDLEVSVASIMAKYAVVEVPLEAFSMQGMLEKRQKDVDDGKIIPFDAAQADVPPFKRTKS